MDQLWKYFHNCSDGAITGRVQFCPFRGVTPNAAGFCLSLLFVAFAFRPDITGESEIRLEVVVGDRPRHDDVAVAPDGDARGGSRRVGPEARGHLAARAEAGVELAVGVVARQPELPR